MRYGLRERITGAVILIALLIIIVPFFFKSGKNSNEQDLQVTVNQTPLVVPQQPDLQQPTPATSEDVASINNSLTQYAQLLPHNETGITNNATDQQQLANTNLIPKAQSNEQTVTNTLNNDLTKPAIPPVTEISQPLANQKLIGNETTIHGPTEAITKTNPSSAANNEITAKANAALDPIMAIVQQKEAQRDLPDHQLQQCSWSIQSGSFTQKANAERMLQQLQKLGFPGYLSQRGANQIVMIGPYDSAQRAQEILQQLNQQANINGFIIQRLQSAE